MTPRRAFLPLLFLALIHAACAGRPPLVAASSSFDVTAREPLVGSVLLDVDEVPEKEVCAATVGTDEICVVGFQSAYRAGLSRIVDAFVRKGEGPRYRATFRLIHFAPYAAEQSLLGTAPARLTIQWQFDLQDNRGNHVAHVERATWTKDTLRDPSEAGPLLQKAIDTSLQELVAALNEAPLHVPDVQRVFPGTR